MIRRPIDDISEADLISLIANGIAEGRSLEFKRELPGGTDAEVKEFLADITSLANAQGGDVVFGILDEDGIAKGIVELAADAVDSTILRLENILRDGLEPRLTGVHCRWIDLAEGGGNLVVRVPASIAAPHRIRFKNSGRFYNRNSRGKYEMDTHELREAFIAAGQLPLRLRELHLEAIESAHGRGLPFGLHNEPSAVVSVMPMSFLRDVRDLPIVPENVVAPHKPGSMSYLHMLEGIVMRTPLDDQHRVRAFALTHRRGRVDAGWTIGGVRENRGNPLRVVWPGSFRDGLLDMAQAATTRLRDLGVEGPWVVFASVSGIDGFIISQDQYFASDPAWRSEATFPEVITDEPSKEALKPILDAFPLLFGIPSTEYAYPSS